MCPERAYPYDDFDGNVREHFMGEIALLSGLVVQARAVFLTSGDHNPAPLAAILRLCEDADAFLRADQKNVVAVHCKGRSRSDPV